MGCECTSRGMHADRPVDASHGHAMTTTVMKTANVPSTQSSPTIGCRRSPGGVALPLDPSVTCSKYERCQISVRGVRHCSSALAPINQSIHPSAHPPNLSCTRHPSIGQSVDPPIVHRFTHPPTPKHPYKYTCLVVKHAARANLRCRPDHHPAGVVQHDTTLCRCSG